MLLFRHISEAEYRSLLNGDTVRSINFGGEVYTLPDNARASIYSTLESDGKTYDDIESDPNSIEISLEDFQWYATGVYTGDHLVEIDSSKVNIIGKTSGNYFYKGEQGPDGREIEYELSIQEILIESYDLKSCRIIY